MSKNEYKPWIAQGKTEVECWRDRYGEMSRQNRAILSSLQYASDRWEEALMKEVADGLESGCEENG